MWTRNSDVPDRNMLEHSIYPSPSKPATSPLCSPYYRYSSELSSSFCILSFLVRATSIDQTFYPATHYLAAVWLDSRHGPNKNYTVEGTYLYALSNVFIGLTKYVLCKQFSRLSIIIRRLSSKFNDVDNVMIDSENTSRRFAYL